MNPRRLRAYILLIIVSVIWAIAGPVIKYTLGGIDPLTFLVCRFALSAVAALVSWPFVGIGLPKDKNIWLSLFIYSFLTSTAALGLLFFGLNKTTVLDMALISAVGPIMVAVGGIIFLNERVTKQEKIGMGLAVLGMFFTIIEPVLSGDGLVRISGNILLLFYLLANSASVIFLKKLLRSGLTPLSLTNFSFIVGFLTTLPVLLLKSEPGQIMATVSNLPPAFHLGIIYMALISGNLAYWLANRAQKTIEVSEAAVFSYLYPILSIPIAVFWLKEEITVPFFIGALIILVGVIIAEYKTKAIAS